MEYTVRFAPDHLMPPGKAFVMWRDDEETVLCLARSVQSCPHCLPALLEDIWAAARLLRPGEEPKVVPKQRVSA